MSWLRVALIDLRGGLGRFGVLLACLALGVATIAAVGSVGAVLQSAITRDATVFLGGDFEAQLNYRPASAEELEYLSRLGRISTIVEFNSQGTSTGTAGVRSAFLAIRAADAAYPLVGTIDTDPVAPLPDLLAERDGAFGAVVDSLLLERLGIALGGRFTIGAASFEARSVLTALPDQAAQGFQLGVPLLISEAALDATGVIQPGTLGRYRYKILLDEGTDFASAAAGLKAAFPEAGWETRSPEDAARDLSEFFDLFGRFLVLVGLSSLLVGGVGVSNAVSAYITERQRSIATMRALGATSRRIWVHFLFQIMALSLVGIIIGVVIGGASTALALPALGQLLSIALMPTVDWPSLAIAAAFGVLIAFAFAFLPLARAQKLRPASLFRSAASGVVEGGLTWRDYLRWQIFVPLGLALGAILGLAILTTDEHQFVLWYAAGAVGAFIVLRLAALALQLLIRLVPPLPSATVRNALKNIHRPGSPTPTVVLSLGLGLSLLLMIALIDSNLRGQLRGEITEDAPSFVFMNMAKPDLDGLAALAGSDADVAQFKSTPMLRGAITKVKDVAVADMGTIPPSVAWMFEGDTSLTWSRDIPEGSKLDSGDWWAADYSGEPLVSLSRSMREPLGLAVGDTIEIAVLGRPIVARIANFREIEWRNRGFNFMIVFSPGLIESAPASYLGTMKAEPGKEDALQSRLVADFPVLAFIPVGEAIARASVLLGSLANAIAIVGGLAVISGVFVLAGALTAGRKQREADAVVMKVLGATRPDVVRAYLVEYGLLGVLSTLLAAVLGSVGAWAVVTRLLKLPFALDIGLIVWVMVGATTITIVTGLISTWSALSVRPSRFLRN